jgi:Flp pilus assembly protein TadD
VANDLASLLLDHRTDEESYRQALQLASRFSRASIPAALDTLGWAYYRNGNYEQAVTFLERAVMGADQAPELRYHLGMAYLALDNPVGARQELDRAISQAQAAEIGFTGMEDAQAALKTLEES